MRAKSKTKKFSDRKQRIFDYLSSNPIGVLSTVNSNCDPHGAVIYFAIDSNFNISFITRNATRKFDNLKHHDHAMLTVYDPKTQTTAQVIGAVHEIRDNDKINEIAQQIFKSSLQTSDAGIPPISKLFEGSYVAFTIDPAQVRMAVYGRPDSGDYTKMFESLESYELHDA